MRTSLFSLAGLVALSLAACGGGGSDGGSNPPPPPPPPPALAPLFTAAGIPANAATSFGYDAAMTATGEVCLGGWSYFMGDTTPTQTRGWEKTFSSAGTPVGLNMVASGNSFEARVYTVAKDASRIGGTIRSDAADPTATEGESFVRLADGTIQLLGGYGSIGGFSASVRGSSSDGLTLVGTGAGAIIRGPVTNNEWNVLPPPAGASYGVCGFDVSENGVVVGVCAPTDFNLQATVWLTPSSGAWLAFPNVSAFSSSAQTISDDGRYIGGFWSDDQGVAHACRWVRNETTQLYDADDLGVEGCVWLVTNAGACFGGEIAFAQADYSVAGSNSAWVWDPVSGAASPLRELLEGLGLDTSHFDTLDVAIGGAEYSTVLVLSGHGLNVDGKQEAWVARIPNNP